jgi:type IV pilus assembly protein PilV
MSSSQPARPPAGGFAMIEILVTLSLIALALLGVAALLVTTHANATSSQWRTQASILGADIAEKVRANRAQVLRDRGAYMDINDRACDELEGADVLAQDIARSICMAKSSLPQGNARVVVDESSSLVTIVVSWDEKTGRNPVTRQTFEFQTEL